MPRRKPVSRLGIGGIVFLAAIVLLALATPALAYPDVPAGHAYEAAINELSSLGIIGGYANGNFGLTDPVKRAQFAKMIVGALDIVPNTSTATRFTDLGTPDANGYPHKYVQTAYDNGITYGTNQTQTLFAPWNSIRRDQVVSMIVRGANAIFPGSLADPPVGTTSLFDGVAEPHGNNLRIADYNGLLDGLIGMGSGWSVTATATRGEVAQMLFNLLQVLEGGPGPSGGDVWVYVNGSGDYPTIEAAVADIEPGTTIHLGPGTFTLTQTIEADFDFDLVGSGMEGANATTVRYAGTVVDIYDATFSAQDIRFVSTATSGASDVMDAQDADATLDSCYFSGANRYNSVAGDGLYVFGSSTAHVTGCVFTLNDLNGIDIDEDTEATLENNNCTSNGSNGIAFWGDSVGTVTGNTCNSNAYEGIVGADNSDVTAEDNTCNENSSDGIGFWDHSVGTVTGNTCSSNDYEGIVGADNSDVTAEDNVCSDNASDGIYFANDATGTASYNTCNNNYYDGISCHDNADVMLEHNTCRYNGEDGIRLSEYNTGTVRYNECSYSQQYDGIDVHDNADAIVQGNICLHNYEAGIYFGDYATGSATGNECANNYYGILADATTHPTIGSNNLHDNIVNSAIAI